jgi:hypothetical protein
MMLSFPRRALSAASVAAIALGGTLFLAAGQAQAVTCTHVGSHTITNSTGVSHATFTLSYGCSDGNVRVSGTIYDDKCDARAGEAQIYGGGQPGFEDPDWTFVAKAGNGCGTHSTFSITKPFPLTQPTLTVNVYACNSNSSPFQDGCSSDQKVVYNI